MTLPPDNSKGSPRERFRNILSAEHDDDAPREVRKPAVVNLPKAGEQATGPLEPPRAPIADGAQRSVAWQRFWTAGSILSLVANMVLVSMLVGGGRASSFGGALPSVYASLAELDNAHVRTSVPLHTSVALDASVPVSAATRITLARDLVVRAAHVTINSSGLSIDSPADITLPAGTQMDVNLELEMPLQGAMPIAADLPVDIAIRDTELHDSIQGLMDTLLPLVCAESPTAVLSDGTPICR